MAPAVQRAIDSVEMTWKRDHDAQLSGKGRPVKTVSLDPTQLLGFRLAVAEAEANGLPVASAALGLKQGGKDGAKLGNKAGEKPV